MNIELKSPSTRTPFSFKIGTPVGGGGLSGSILFIDSGLKVAQDNSNFFWDDTNNRLGIGTASPANTLHMKGGTTPQLIVESSGVASYIQFHTTDTGTSGASDGLTVGYNAAAYIFNREATSLFLGTSGTTAVEINSTGNVLVNGFTASTKGLIVKAAASQSANLQEWQNSSGTAISNVNQRGQISAIIPTSDTTSKFGFDGIFNAATDLTGMYAVGGDIRMSGTLLAAGLNMPVGVFARARMSVALTTITDTAALMASIFKDATGTVTNVYGVIVPDLTNSAGTITNTYGVYVGDITTGTQTNTPFSFYASDANAYSYFAGNVGIGTTSPSTALSMGDDKLITRDVNAGITASTTQTQGQGALTAEVNEVATVANANDTVTLPAAGTGLRIVIINNGANTLRIFPASGDNLGAGVDTATTLAAGSNVIYQSYNATNWEAI